MKFDPNSNALPKRSELPAIPGAPDGAAWFWGSNDEVQNHHWFSQDLLSLWTVRLLSISLDVLIS